MNDARIDIRLPAETRELLEHAAAIEGVSLSAFIVGNATIAAKQVVAEHTQWKLSCADSRKFVAAILEQEPTP